MKKVQRVQTGVRMERTLVKVLKATAEYTDLTLGDLLEGIVLHAIEGRPSPFQPDTLEAIAGFRRIYGLELTADDAHRLTEAP
jgi:predicted DNA-binding ribbon-helix-helix protein